MQVTLRTTHSEADHFGYYGVGLGELRLVGRQSPIPKVYEFNTQFLPSVPPRFNGMQLRAAYLTLRVL